MITQNPATPQTVSPSDLQAGPAAASTPVMDPRKPIETAAGGSGTVHDPAGSDIKPPVSDGFEYPV